MFYTVGLMVLVYKTTQPEVDIEILCLYYLGIDSRFCEKNKTVQVRTGFPPYYAGI